MKASMRAQRRRGRQFGQATVEFAVACLVLVPLFIAVPLLGKYLDLMQATENASRYVAFEAMARNSSNAWRSDAELAVDVRRRFFGNSDAPVKTRDAAGDFSAHRNPLWTDPTGKPLLAHYEQDVQVHTTTSSKNAIAASGLYASSLGLSTNNWYDASVTVRIADIPGFKPLDSIGLKTTRHTVLLADAWTARDNAQVRARIEGGGWALYPIQKLDVFVDLLGQVPPVIFDPALKVGEFDWDVVPCDRLVGGC